MCSLCHYKSGLRGNLDKHIRTVHQLDVVTKHTVHLKMKFKGRQSGDILSKDGELINVVQDHRGEDPRRLQVFVLFAFNINPCFARRTVSFHIQFKGCMICFWFLFSTEIPMQTV